MRYLIFAKSVILRRKTHTRSMYVLIQVSSRRNNLLW